MLVTCLVGVVACGDNAKPCDYVETDDTGNATTSETTNLTIDDHGVHVCGAIDSGHFVGVVDQLDQDSYRVTVATAGPMLVQIFGGDGVTLFSDMSVRLFDTAANPTLLAEGLYVPTLADHGAFLVTLAPGDYDLIVSAHAPGELSAPVPYRIRLSPMPACDALTNTDYTEAHDGDSSTGNDMVDINFTQDPSFTATASTTDAPESTGLAIGAGQSYLIAGASTNTPNTDQYLDRDTFDLATDDTANELAIRLDWDSTSSDLDYVVFEASTLTPVAISNVTSTSVHELATFAVQPSTHYWLWVGGFKGGTPTPYRATTCGGHFFY